MHRVVALRHMRGAVPRRLARAPRAATATLRAKPPSVGGGLPRHSSGAARAAIDRPVAYWLFGCGGLVAGMVSVGGLTRLTRSGLSMTDWKITGGAPPRSPAEWEAEFARYKLFPEWQQRQSMTVEDFKFIYFWEYSHRMLGRVVGVAFGVPLAYFWSRGRLTPWLKPRLAGLLALGGTQGLVGWWMVRSGLDAALMPERQRSDVRVSPYRLATHLGLALTSYSGLVWCGLEVLRGNPALGMRGAPRAPLAVVATGAAGLALVTAVSGACVAGNDAGCAFNTWPYMIDDRDIGGGAVFMPPWKELTDLAPMYRNAFENTAAAQFDHRSLAYATAAAVAAVALATRGVVGAPPAARTASALAAAAVAGQVSLGVATLLLYVPMPLAACHQFGSLVVLTTTLATAHALRRAPASALVLAPAAAVAALA